MTIEGAQSPSREEESSDDDDDVEDQTYMPSPGAPTRGRGKGLASVNGSGPAEIQEEEE
jgi:hypothetical protein